MQISKVTLFSVFFVRVISLQVLEIKQGAACT